jgi:hypothetical protein
MARCQNVLSLTVTVAATLTVLLCSQLMPQSRATAQKPSSSDTIKSPGTAPSEIDRAINENARRMLEQGRHIFRYDTFGSEAYWGDELQLHRALAGEKNGGVGDGVSPKTALSVGLKVDADALPDSLRQQLKAGKVDLNDPATTVALLKLNAVVGLTGFFDQKGNLRSMGLQCAFCHSTVDNSLHPESGSAWTPGQIATSTSGLSFRSLQT